MNLTSFRASIFENDTPILKLLRLALVRLTNYIELSISQQAAKLEALILA